MWPNPEGLWLAEWHLDPPQFMKSLKKKKKTKLNHAALIVLDLFPFFFPHGYLPLNPKMCCFHRKDTLAAQELLSCMEG